MLGVLIAWVVFPVVLVLLSAGWGLLLERATRALQIVGPTREAEGRMLSELHTLRGVAPLVRYLGEPPDDRSGEPAASHLSEPETVQVS